jgi:hypothetical protein
MKIMLDRKESDYLEIKQDNGGKLDLSIRTTNAERKSLIITAKLDFDAVDKIIANLILLKTKMTNEQKK